MKNRKFEGCSFMHRIAGLMRLGIALLVCLMVAGLASAQDVESKPSSSLPLTATAVGDPITNIIPGIPNPVKLTEKARLSRALPVTDVRINALKYLDVALTPRIPVTNLDRGAASPGTVRELTLDEAIRRVHQADNPMVRLGQLGVEVAKQARRGVAANYYPAISGYFVNFHIDKQTGEFNTTRRISGQPVTVPVNIVEKDLTLFNVNVIQPITPILQIREGVKVARADENIAKAKAGIPIAAQSKLIQTKFYELLISQRELAVARAKSKRADDTYVRVSNTQGPQTPAEMEEAMTEAARTLALAENKVAELTVSLNGLLGFAIDTELRLIAPAPLSEEITLARATRQAQQSNPAVIEAEQTLIKARAGKKVAKLAYMPEVAIMGGYVYNNAFRTILPENFAYIGVLATMNIFDGGKREALIKQRRAQVEMAEIAVQLQKAKAAKDANSSFFEVDRLRKLSELARRRASGSWIKNAGYAPNSLEIEESRAAAEIRMFKAELAYRDALARLKQLMGVPVY